MFHARFNRYVAVALAALLGASCSDSSTAPRPAATSELDRVATVVAHTYIARGEIVKRTGNLQDDITATGTITPDGGSLSLPEAGLVLFFPRGAVSQPVEVTATALKGKRLVYDFQPHGLVFDTPIYVAQQLRGTELNAQRTQKKGLDVWAGYLSRGSADILADGRANFSETFAATFYGTGAETLAVFTTTHFSGYAMASGRRELPGLPGF